MVMRLINHIILVQARSSDLGIGSMNPFLDIKSSRHICVIISFTLWPHPNLSSTLLYLLIIVVCVFHRVEGPSISLEQDVQTKKITSRSIPNLDLVVVAWEEFSQSPKGRTTGASYSKWWARRLASHSISMTLQNVNISFNHDLPYYSMRKDDGRVVTKKYLDNEA